MLKISPDLSIPASNGYVAKTIGTAPLRPTQETKCLVLFEILLKGISERKTAKGRDIIISEKATNNPIAATS
jgi:hypothetical protein